MTPCGNISAACRRVPVTLVTLRNESAGSFSLNHAANHGKYATPAGLRRAYRRAQPQAAEPCDTTTAHTKPRTPHTGPHSYPSTTT